MPKKDDDKVEETSNPAVDAHKADKAESKSDKHDGVHDKQALRPDAIAEAEAPGVAPEVEVNLDPPAHPDPTTVEEIDAILRNPDFDPSGVERQRLMELSKRISAKGPAAPAPVFDQAIGRGAEPGVTK